MMKCLSLLCLLTLFVAVGCVSSHYYSFTPNTDPPVDSVYAKNSMNTGKPTYLQEITDADRSAGKINIPALIFFREGFLPYEYSPNSRELNDGFWKNSAFNNGRYEHRYENSRQIRLKPDPNFQGYAKKNQVRLTINSEPQGARIYEDGKLCGTTPCAVYYSLEKRNYDSNIFSIATLTLKLEGYMDAEHNFKMPVNSEWLYERDQTLKKTTLAVLKPDPNFQGYAEKNQVRLTINSEPQGARIYEDGKLCGTTPCAVYYSLEKRNYDSKSLNIATLTLVLEGFLPKEHSCKITVDPKWLYEKNKVYDKATLAILKRDYAAPQGSSISTNQKNVHTGGHSQSEYAAAKAEYDRALAAYNKALKELDTARNLRTLSDITFPGAMGGKPFDQVMGLTNRATTHISLQEAERNAQITLERLQRAKSRLSALEWK